MHVPPPQNIAEIAADGALTQALVDVEFEHRFGSISSAEALPDREVAAQFGEIGHMLPDSCLVRMQLKPGKHRSSGSYTNSVLERRGHILGDIGPDGLSFQWNPATRGMMGAFDIPELYGSQALSPQLIQAARTLTGNTVVVWARWLDGVSQNRNVLVALELLDNDIPVVDRPGLPNFEQALTAAAARVSYAKPSDEPGTEPKQLMWRSIIGLVSFLRIRVRIQEASAENAARLGGVAALGVSEGTTVELTRYEFNLGYALEVREESPTDSGLLRSSIVRVLNNQEAEPIGLAGVVADSWLNSAEHQLLLDGRFPEAQLHLTHKQRNGCYGAVLYPAQVAVEATIVAFIEGDSWVWAHAHPLLNSAAAEAIKAFGLDHGMVDLVRQQMPLEYAQRMRLLEAVKPLVNIWSHTSTTVSLPDGSTRTALVLLQHPYLELPPLGEAAAKATLDQAVPPVIAAFLPRALRAYARARRIRVSQSRVKATQWRLELRSADPVPPQSTPPGPALPPDTFVMVELSQDAHSGAPRFLVL